LVALPLSMIVWANLHGGFLVGPLVVGCFLAGSAVEARRRDETAARARRLLAPLGAALAGTLLAMLANPWGPGLVAHLLRFALVPPALDDFAPATVRDRAGLALAVFALLCAGGAAAAAARRRPRAPFPPGTLIACGLGLAMAAASIRHVEVAAVFGAGVISGGASALAGSRRSGLLAYERDRGGALFAVTIVALLSLAIVGRYPAAGYDPQRFPVAAVEAVRGQARPGETVFAPALWGGYIVLEWPRARVFVDGRWDLYGQEFLEEYASIASLRPGWERRLEAAGVRWAILPPDWPMAATLGSDPAWEIRWADETSIALRRRPDPLP
jgi:hypothetical protein